MAESTFDIAGYMNQTVEGLRYSGMSDERIALDGLEKDRKLMYQGLEL